MNCNLYIFYEQIQSKHNKYWFYLTECHETIRSFIYSTLVRYAQSNCMNHTY